LTKPEIALRQITAAVAQGVPAGVVLADAAYGNDSKFRNGLEALGLQYALGVQSTTTVWPAGSLPLARSAIAAAGDRSGCCAAMLLISPWRCANWRCAFRPPPTAR
jgi:SRSO17 transposase